MSSSCLQVWGTVVPGLRKTGSSRDFRHAPPLSQGLSSVPEAFRATFLDTRHPVRLAFLSRT